MKGTTSADVSADSHRGPGPRCLGPGPHALRGKKPSESPLHPVPMAKNGGKEARKAAEGGSQTWGPGPHVVRAKPWPSPTLSLAVVIHGELS